MADLLLREETEKKYCNLPREEKRYVEGYMTAVLQMLDKKKKRRPKPSGERKTM